MISTGLWFIVPLLFIYSYPLLVTLKIRILVQTTL